MGPPFKYRRKPNSLHARGSGSGGVIWYWVPFETPVIPAKAGIQSFDNAFPKVCRVDSRFRGNDGLQRPCLANDTGTPAGFCASSVGAWLVSLWESGKEATRLCRWRMSGERTRLRIALNAGTDRLFEITSQGHCGSHTPDDISATAFNEAPAEAYDLPQRPPFAACLT